MEKVDTRNGRIEMCCTDKCKSIVKWHGNFQLEYIVHVVSCLGNSCTFLPPTYAARF